MARSFSQFLERGAPFFPHSPTVLPAYFSSLTFGFLMNWMSGIKTRTNMSPVFWVLTIAWILGPLFETRKIRHRTHYNYTLEFHRGALSQPLIIKHRGDSSVSQAWEACWKALNQNSDFTRIPAIYFNMFVSWQLEPDFLKWYNPVATLGVAVEKDDDVRKL